MKTESKPSIATFLYENTSNKKGKSCVLQFESYMDLSKFIVWAKGYVKLANKNKIKIIKSYLDIEKAVESNIENKNIIIDWYKLLFPIVHETGSVLIADIKLMQLLMLVRQRNNCVMVVNQRNSKVKITPRVFQVVNYEYDCEPIQSDIGVASNNVSNQAEIVKQRLHYHFAKTDGTWNIPKDMPFMKEFLNEVKKLCDIAS